ncbi:hypothetical protein Y1Q_0012878 [Alligator mississippiensis]|uniref:Uncharacterized protein n=1 Tax=Alligator mississippiensis TaxID=8496 RepID=A0A151P4B9_ALLMI|nr:hypothetical protein Y1Q_0012878 [Alligator mississippiensis]
MRLCYHNKDQVPCDSSAVHPSHVTILLVETATKGSKESRQEKWAKPVFPERGHCPGIAIEAKSGSIKDLGIWPDSVQG